MGCLERVVTVLFASRRWLAACLLYERLPVHSSNVSFVFLFALSLFCQGLEMGKLFTVALAAFAATGSFLFGYDSGVMTDVIASKNFLTYFNTVPTSAIVGAINSTFSGGGELHVPLPWVLELKLEVLQRQLARSRVV